MNVLKYRVSLDMFDTLSQTTIKAKKGDSACQIHITLTEHGKVFHIGEGCYATFNAKKSDGNFIEDNCTIDGDTIVYNFATSIEDGTCQVSACEGNVECEVTLYKANGEQLTSPRFILYIDGTVYNGEKITSTTEENVLKDLINETLNTIDMVETKLENGEFKGDKGDKGEQGDAFTYEDFTEEQLASLKGEKGDKGDKGDQGLQGIQGEKGDRGERGLQGIQGIQGEQGIKGDKGDKGEQGDTYTLTNADKTDIANIVLTNFTNVAEAGQ
jgi:hypothetical protein